MATPRRASRSSSGLSANVIGDYQEKGGYNLIDPAKRGAVDVASQVIQRNAYRTSQLRAVGQLVGVRDRPSVRRLARHGHAAVAARIAIRRTSTSG